MLGAVQTKGKRERNQFLDENKVKSTSKYSLFNKHLKVKISALSFYFISKTAHCQFPKHF